MDSRRLPNPTQNSALPAKERSSIPSSSGPRCASARVPKLSARSTSTERLPTSPKIPHTPNYLANQRRPTVYHARFVKVRGSASKGGPDIALLWGRNLSFSLQFASQTRRRNDMPELRVQVVAVPLISYGAFRQ